MRDGLPMTMRFLLALTIAGLAASAATAAEPASLTMTNLARGKFSGLEKPLQKVIRDAGEWKKVWMEHSRIESPSPELPKVDFHRQMVIVAAMGRQRTGGYSIEIKRAESETGRLRVFLKTISPPKGAMSIQALTSPFHFVSIPKVDFPVEFVEEHGGL